MKFTKEQLSEALMARLSNNGKKDLAISKRSFNEEVEELFAELSESGNNEGLELDDIVGKKIKHFERFDNNIRYEKSKFKKEQEKEHSGKGDKDDGNEGNGDEGNDSKLDKLLKEIQALKAEREEEKKSKAIFDKRNQLKSALKGKDVKNEDWINDQLELVHIDSETDVDALTERLVKSYNKFSSNTPPDVTPGGAGGGTEKSDDYSDVVAIVKKQSHRN
jgi:hypothetical protein